MKLHNSKLRPLIVVPVALLLVNVLFPSSSWSRGHDRRRNSNTSNLNAGGSAQKANTSQPSSGTSEPSNSKTNASQHKK
jgi:uncharacterized membrane protein affecting hemolysin expression